MATVDERPAEQTQPPSEQRAIVLVGFMGAGKTTAARALAEGLGAEAVDADEEVERQLGEPIAAHFAREGEGSFREVEERVTLDLLNRGGVVALGGGAVESRVVREALKEHFTVWCGVAEDTAWERSRLTGRPLAADRDEFARRYRERLPLYEAVARAVMPECGAAVAWRAAPWIEAVAALPDGRLAWASSATAEYPAAVGQGALGLLGIVQRFGATDDHALGDRPARWFCVADGAMLEHHRDKLPEVAGLVEVEASAERKTLAEAGRVISELAAAGVRRDDGLIAFGGGMVGDLAGFCGAVYLRGVPVVQAPTTLVAQVDSAYGGKTGVDLPEAKNYVGAYHLPQAVLADPSILATLPAGEMAAGFAEVLKTALIAGGRLWEEVRSLESLDPAGLGEVIFACARAKLDVVAEDERDAGRRAVLNFGHTVGHAIEAASGYRRYRHGEAVGLGLLAALRLSSAGELRSEVADILARHELPTALDPDVGVDEVLAAIELDKKRTAEGVGFVLLEHPGEPRVGELVDPVSIRAAVEELR